MVMFFHAAVGYSRDRPQSQHYFRVSKFGATRLFLELTILPPLHNMCQS
jgi:hypothetical protein